MCDWNRYGNVFWRKDFPIMPNPPGSEKPNAFVTYLSTYVDKIMFPHRCEMENFLAINFKNFLINETQMNLIGSIPGHFPSTEPFRLSFYQGMHIIKNNPPVIPFTLESTKIYYVTSSLGSLNFKLLYDFSKMIFPEPSFNWEKATANKLQLINMFNVIYPSKNYISGSYFGESRANCLFLRRMIYDSFKFQKSVMRAFEGNLNIEGNNSILPHYKIWIVTHNGKFDDDTILYIGSHNFTQSAWGKFEKNDDQIEIFNYELGVIIPSKPNTALMKQSIIENFGVSIPAQVYSQHDQPFFIIED
jgi:tyrosyl-DNA phosphodiesterase-1